MAGTTRAVHPGGRSRAEARRSYGIAAFSVMAHRSSARPSAERGIMRSMLQPERHLGHRSNWLRAGVLGANDGIVSTASLVLGVAASGAARAAILTAGIAGLVAGALSMAAGEFVSVSSQRDAELADLDLERRELGADPEGELDELARIYESRGLETGLAREVAVAMSERDALTAHARDELGLEEARRARPLQAAWASALAFSAGAILPVIAVSAVARGGGGLLLGRGGGPPPGGAR